MESTEGGNMAIDTPDLQAILQRVERLEGENRRWRRTGLAIVVLSAGVLATCRWRGAGGTIEASGLVIRDRQGRHRLEMTMDYDTSPNGNPRIRLLDEKGTPRCTIGAGVLTLTNNKGTAGATLLADILQFGSENNTVAARLGGSKGGGELWLFGNPTGGNILLSANAGPHLTLSGSEGKTFVGMSALKDGARLTVDDEAGFEAELGNADLVTTATGEKHKTSAASLVLFGKDRKVLWRAP